MAYPVTVQVERALQQRNRLTTGFRLILYIPHLILVGGLGFVTAAHRNADSLSFGGEAGVLGTVAWVMAVISWFTILFSGVHIIGIRQFTAFYLRWRVRGLSYLMLLTDQYPPFGDAPYPASISIVDPTAPRDRLSVGLRLLFVLPHAIVLFFLIFVLWITTVIAWFSIVLGGTYPAGLYDFGVGMLRWFLRVEAYVLLMVDEYPPFGFE